MPSKKQYDLVQNDDFDTRIPLHTEEAFQHGITFQAKFIGSLDVPRPTSRVEIVAAMRRIRYEFKAKGIKKKKVIIEVSVEGVKVTLRKKKKRKQWPEDGKSTLLSHPIYRIFYVSHDSQDMKIFSYIARDGASNVFKCAVFKSNKKSQAMRVVRTVGQAFEVCHKLSINAPENDNLDQEEQDTLTQDLLSDRLSDVASERCRKDLHLETDMDRISLPGCEDYCLKDSPESKTSRQTMPRQLDLLPPPPSLNNKPSSLISAETYSSPQSDALATENNSTSISLPPAGSALSAHHEIQLLREQLDQQNQQTQAAMAQLQVVRDQLVSEQAARVEAQTRTHQLLVHNRELLDHIASLVSHLQSGSDKSGGLGGQQQNSTHVTLPQHLPSGVSENYMPDLSGASLDNSLHQALGMTPPGLIENRAVAAHLPPSPLGAFSPTGTMFNFPYAQEVPTFENQLLHRLSGYSTAYPFNFNPPLPYPYYPASNVLNNNFALAQPPRKYSASPLTARHSRGVETHGVRHNSEPRQFPYQFNTNLSTPTASSVHLQNYSQQIQNDMQQNSRATNHQSPTSPTSNARPSSLIKPLSQVGTLTTTDAEGKVRVIVPVPSGVKSNSINNNNDPEGLLANLKLTDDFRMTGAPIQRTTSEKVPNRSELMSQVQRAMWARHTTK